MALTLLPYELLEMIIMQVLPEGFESMAVTCKGIHALCIPFIEQHNTLRSQFHHFYYYKETRNPSLTIGTAFDLITRIAVEPRIARYIRSAIFEDDSLLVGGPYHELIQDFHSVDAVIRLFADSPYLKQAGLDWQKYYAEIEENRRTACYSQHAAAFLLTLLPNLENLRLPERWMVNDATEKLIDVVSREAKHSHLPHESPSLARVSLCGLSAYWTREDCNSNWASPFLALPRLRSFYGTICVPMTFKNLNMGFATTLETVDFVGCYIDEVGMGEFLKHSPCLKRLRYSHASIKGGGHQDWDICKLVTIIARMVGNHLEVLSVFKARFDDPIAPGRVSMSGFRRLQKLELPLEIAICSINATAACRTITTPEEASPVQDIPTNHHELNDDEPFLDEVIPASVSQLSLILTATDDHAKALDVIFRDFAVRKKITLPALGRIFLTCPNNAKKAYKEQCTSLIAETEKAGVVLDLMQWPPYSHTSWKWKEFSCLLFPFRRHFRSQR